MPLVRARRRAHSRRHESCYPPNRLPPTACLHLLPCFAVARMGRISRPRARLPRKSTCSVFSRPTCRASSTHQVQVQARRLWAAIQNPPRHSSESCSGGSARSAVQLREWSGVGAQKIGHRLDDHSRRWRPPGFLPLRSSKRPRAFADRTPRSAAAIDFRHGHARRAPFQGQSTTIDVSGDGTNNSRPRRSRCTLRGARQGSDHHGSSSSRAADVVERRPTNTAGGLDTYYRNNLTGGPAGSFVLVAEISPRIRVKGDLNNAVAEISVDRATRRRVALERNGRRRRFPPSRAGGTPARPDDIARSRVHLSTSKNF